MRKQFVGAKLYKVIFSKNYKQNVYSSLALSILISLYITPFIYEFICSYITEQMQIIITLFAHITIVIF